jgi:hypothetical protein
VTDVNVARWDDDAITHYLLHMRITNLTVPNPTSSPVTTVLNIFNNLVLAVRAVGMDVVPQVIISSSHFFVPALGNANVTDARSREVE